MTAKKGGTESAPNAGVALLTQLGRVSKATTKRPKVYAKKHGSKGATKSCEPNSSPQEISSNAARQRADRRIARGLLSMPECFDSLLQWRLWLKADSICNVGNDSHYCADCLPKYQTEMILQERCAYPGTVFVNGDGVRPGTGSGRREAA